MSRYTEQLKDPRWQRMRLKVLERENFTCQACERNDKTLHVHHTYYEKGKAPWEYPSESLRVLCEDCHSNAGLKQIELAREIAKLQYGELDQVIGYVRAMNAMWYDLEKGGDEKRADIPVANAEQVEGVMDAFHIHVAWEGRYLDPKRATMDTERLAAEGPQVRAWVWQTLLREWGHPYQ